MNNRKLEILKDPKVVEFLDVWFPVIEKIGEVQAHYAGSNKEKTPLFCPDSTADLIVEYNKAQKAFGIKRAPVYERT